MDHRHMKLSHLQLSRKMVSRNYWERITCRCSPNKGISSSIVASIALSKTYEDGWFDYRKNGLKGTSNIGYYGDQDGNCAGSSTNQLIM